MTFTRRSLCRQDFRRWETRLSLATSTETERLTPVSGVRPRECGSFRYHHPTTPRTYSASGGSRATFQSSETLMETAKQTSDSTEMACGGSYSPRKRTAL